MFQVFKYRSTVNNLITATCFYYSNTDCRLSYYCRVTYLGLSEYHFKNKNHCFLIEGLVIMEKINRLYGSQLLDSIWLQKWDYKKIIIPLLAYTKIIWQFGCHYKARAKIIRQLGGHYKTRCARLIMTPQLPYNFCACLIMTSKLPYNFCICQKREYNLILYCPIQQ